MSSKKYEANEYENDLELAIILHSLIETKKWVQC